MQRTGRLVIRTMSSFWDTLEKPFFVLAPLADVTDAAFRRVIAKYSKPAPALRSLGEVGGPAVMWTEFVSADGLMLATEEGKKKLMADLIYTEAERPIVAQFFTSKPEMMRRAAKLARELGFDGVDINMGCPDRSVEKQGAGAALIKTPKLATALIHEAKKGAGDLPVSVKTRIGYNTNEIETWLPVLLEAEPAVVTIHARTRKEMSKVPAQWDQIKRAVEIRNEMKSDALILGNGDVLSLADARLKAQESGCDGVMLGRAIFGNPYLFAEQKEDSGSTIHESRIVNRLNVMVEHTMLFEQLLGHYKSFAVMKKHFKAYVNGFDGLPAAPGRLTASNAQAGAAQAGAKELRETLMACANAQEVAEKTHAYLADRALTAE